MSSAPEILRAQVAVPIVAALSSASGARLVVPGPTWLVIAGVSVPIFSAGAGVLGVALGLWLAPPRAEPLGWRRQSALAVTLLAIILCSVITTGQQPLVALGWGIGLGFSGLAVAETLGAQASKGIKAVTDAFIAAAAGRIGGKGNSDGAN